MAVLFDTLIFFLNIIALFVGLLFCVCSGYLLEQDKEPMPLLEYNTSLAFFVTLGGSMVGAAGGRLELWTWQVVFKEKPPIPFFGAILLVICGFACVSLGMWMANEEKHPSDTE